MKKIIKVGAIIGPIQTNVAKMSDRAEAPKNGAKNKTKQKKNADGGPPPCH